MRFRYNPRIAVVTALVCATALVAACSSSGGSSGGGNGGSSAGSSPGNGLSGKPIGVAALVPVQAPYYSSPDTLAAITAGIDYVNSRGGIAGRPLKLDWCNEKNDANAEVACTQGFAQSDDVLAVGTISVVNGDATEQILSSAGLADVGVFALTTSEFSSTSDFPTDGGVGPENAAAVNLAVKNSTSGKRVVMFHSDSSYDTAWESITRSATEAAGGTLAGIVKAPASVQADWSPYAEKVLALKPDIVDMPVAASTAMPFAEALRSLGFKGQLVGTAGIFSQSDIASSAGALDNMLIGTPTPWMNDTAAYPGMKIFDQAMASLAKSGNSNANPASATPLVASYFASVLAAADVMNDMVKSGQQVTRSSFLSAFKAAKNINTGILPDWTPGAYLPIAKTFGYANVTDFKDYVLEYEGGQYKLVQPDPVDTTQFMKS